MVNMPKISRKIKRKIKRKITPGLGNPVVVGKGGKERKVKVRHNPPTPAPIGKIGTLPKMPKKLKPSKPMRPRKGNPVNRPLPKLGRGMARMVKR